MNLTVQEIRSIQVGGVDWYGSPLSIDGKYGPRTAWWHGISLLSEERQTLIKTALAYHAIGAKEEPSIENGGTFVDMLLKPVGLKNVSWCLAFVSHCQRKSGIKLPTYFTGAEQLIQAVSSPSCTYAHFVDTPIPGDVEVFLYDKKPGDTRTPGHGRIVLGFESNTKKTAGVDGNVNDAVRVGYRHDRPNRKFVRFDAMGESHNVLTMPSGMMSLDNLTDR